jgi:hypothetical protein
MPGIIKIAPVQSTRRKSRSTYRIEERKVGPAATRRSRETCLNGISDIRWHLSQPTGKVFIGMQVTLALGLFDLNRNKMPVGEAYQELILNWKDILNEQSYGLPFDIW